mmetsp:Transcript_71708/g.145059  ORF Transcript_71708/g.145059 Transcript_71708/m.145059 type:complete len:91 (+) Transcript_71708:916-1188(+)
MRPKQGELVPNSWVSKIQGRIQRRSCSRNISLSFNEFSRTASLTYALVVVKSLLNWQQNMYERLLVIDPPSDDRKIGHYIKFTYDPYDLI